MSFQFYPRKLLINDSFQDSISEVCQPYCIDRTLNKDGSCPILCMSQCYQTCYHPLPLIPELLPPPPPPPPPPVSYHHLSKSFGLSVFLIVFLAVLATTFFLFFSYIVYKLFRQRRRQATPPQREVDDDDVDDEEMRLNFIDEDRGPVVDHPIWYIRTPGLQSSVISAITVCKYKKGDGLVEGTDCSVCLNEFQEDESLRLLPKCNHAFHVHCIDTWLRSHTNCPMCRAGIVINSARFQSPSNTVEEETLDRVSGDLNIRVLSSSRDMENEGHDTTIEVDDVNENRCSIIGSRDGIQPLRRSVSLDSLSASVMSSAITDAFAVNSGRRSLEYKQDLELEMNGTRSSNNQSLSKSSAGGSSSMVVRSFSCSAKVFLSRYSSRSSRISVVPLPRSF